MLVREVRDILSAEVITGENNMNIEVKSACGSDMMSDVLAFVKDQSLLITGLVNPQVVRTAEMMDMHCIVFVRGKRPDNEVISLANERGIVLLATGYRMFTACGLLFSHGLQGGNMTE
jgi:predicted transcriptional regulator